MFTKNNKYALVRIALIAVLIVGMFGTHLAQAEAMSLGWVQGGGGANRDFGTSVAVDGNGNVYATGFVSDGSNNQSIFIHKRDASGNLLWGKVIVGTTSYTTSREIALDASGNLYVTGAFAGTVDFDPDAGTSNLTSAGYNDAFISKFDAAGNFLWAKSLGAASYDSANAIAIDGGNIYLVGYYSDTVDFDPGAGTSNLTSAGYRDVFLSKLDGDGNLLWVKGMGGTADDEGFGLAIDGSGNIFITGYFFGTADFDPGAGITNLTSAGGFDIFVNKLDNNGDLVWAKKAGGTSDDNGTELTLDGSGNVYVVGYAGTSGYDIFMSKLNGSGNFLWTHTLGGIDLDSAYGVVVDGNGDLYITGEFAGTVDFDPGTGTHNLTSAGTGDIYIAKFDNNGNFISVKGLGGTSEDAAYDAALDESGNLYLTGYFSDTVDFDPGPGTNNLVSAGVTDIFISKLTLTPQIYYVKWDAAGTEDGSSWTDAFTDLQSALAAASSGDQIWVAAGTYQPTTDADRTVSFTLKNGVAVYGGFAGTESSLTERDPVANVTILSGDIGTAGDSSDNSYHVVVGSGTDASAVLDGFTVTAGNADTGPNNLKGGGMYNYIGSPTITNVIFSQNAAKLGGGMFNDGEAGNPPPVPGSHPTLTNVTFDHNSALEGGGLENMYSSSPSLTDVIFDTNTVVRSGGGMLNMGSDPTLTNVTFRNNVAGGGGGMSNVLSDPTLTNVTFTNNSAEFGGGMANGESNVTITGATFNDNTATTYGGGLSNETPGSLSLTNVTFYHNTAGTYGGGVYNSALLTLTNGTLSDNYSPTQPGTALYNSGTLNFSNTIVANSWSACFNVGTIGTDIHNLVEDSGACGSPVVVIDPNLGPLSDNGGPTLTMALLPGSPAMDAGDNGTCALTDQRGVTRPQGPTCDIGAYEAVYLTISGNAGVGGAVVKYGYRSFTTADNDGNYSFQVPPGWTDTVIPIKLGYSFTPAKTDYSDVLVGRSNQDYTATANTYSPPGDPGETWRASLTNAGAQPDDDSYDPAISADGRYVAYWSFASNLVPGQGETDVVVYDNQTGQTSAASVDSNGTPLDCNSYHPSISADGRFVSLTSCAGGGGSLWLVYVYDRHTGLLESVARADISSISADGRYLAYSSRDNSANQFRIFVEDMLTKEATQVSLSSTGGQPNGDSIFLVISADGRYVAFESSASNLVDGDTNNAADIFVYDTQTSTTQRVSVNSSGLQANGGSFVPSISGDGRYIAFHSTATNLVANDTNGKNDVFIHDLQTGETSRVSVSNGVQGNKHSDHAHISADGRYVAFRSLATNLISNDTNGVADIFVYDRQTNQTRRVSVDSNAVQANGASPASYSPVFFSISGDGKYLAFSSDATNLVTGDTNEKSDIFVRDVSNSNPPVLSAPGNGEVLLHKRPTFDWEDIPNASSYQIAASKSTSFSVPLWNVSTTTSKYTPPADLPAGKVIYWRVRALVGGTWSAWSAPWSFTTANPPSIPVLVSPSNKALTKDYTPLLNWSDATGANFHHYEVQIDTDKLFADPVLIKDATLITSSYTPGTDLAANSRYFWRVRSFNAAGQYSSWSTVWVFYTALPKPGNLTPQGEEMVSSRRPALHWDGVDGASGYSVQLSSSSSFATLLVNTTTTTNTFTPSTKLPANTTIYWRVRATGTHGPGSWSTASFHTP